MNETDADFFKRNKLQDVILTLNRRQKGFISAVSFNNS